MSERWTNPLAQEVARIHRAFAPDDERSQMALALADKIESALAAELEAASRRAREAAETGPQLRANQQEAHTGDYSTCPACDGAERPPCFKYPDDCEGGCEDCGGFLVCPKNQREAEHHA